MRALLFAMALGLLPLVAAAGDACCPPACDVGCNAGCNAGCGKRCFEGQCCPKCGGKLICKLVCEEKEIKKTVWDVECEPFCKTLPRLCDPCGGKRGCCGQCNCEATPGCCDCANGQCASCCDPCAVELAKNRLPPKCSAVAVRKKLVKKEVTCKVPCYKCVPVCPCCGDGCSRGCGDGGASPAPSPSDIPPRTTLLAPLPPTFGLSYSR